MGGAVSGGRQGRQLGAKGLQKRPFSVISRRHLLSLLAIRRISRPSFSNLLSRCRIPRQCHEVVSSAASTLVMSRHVSPVYFLLLISRSNDYYIAPVPHIYYASHSYPACSFLLFVPPLVPRIVSGSCVASFARFWLLPKVVFILYSEFLDSNMLKEMYICL